MKKVSSAFLMAVGADLERRPLRFAVSQQLRADQPGESARQHSGRRRIAPRLRSRCIRCASGSIRTGCRPCRLNATDIGAAIQAQNRQNPAGAIGKPPTPQGTDFQYSVSAPGRLTDPSQFEDIVIRSQPDASLLRVRDVARVELGAQSYGGFSRLNGRLRAT